LERCTVAALAEAQNVINKPKTNTDRIAFCSSHSTDQASHELAISKAWQKIPPYRHHRIAIALPPTDKAVVCARSRKGRCNAAMSTKSRQVIRHTSALPIWKLEAALKSGPCKKGRYAPPVHMIKLTMAREITPYVWVHPDEEG
jgi:hypothetical protein